MANMIILITGGSGSGKSEYAESLCTKFDSGRRLYIATMEPFGEEAKKRIDRHRRLRAGKGFETMECYTHLENVKVKARTTVLLECLSNLTANEKYSDSGRRDQVCGCVLKGIRRLADQAEHLVIVTNDVFSDGICHDDSTVEYIRELARINRQVAAMADQVAEVVCGIPIYLRRGM